MHSGAAGIRGLTANLPMSTTDMLSALTTAPHEYSYFDHGKLGAWAGPKHWKFKPMARPTVSVDKKIRKKKVKLKLMKRSNIQVDEDCAFLVHE